MIIVKDMKMAVSEYRFQASTLPPKYTLARFGKKPVNAILEAVYRFCTFVRVYGVSIHLLVYVTPDYWSLAGDSSIKTLRIRLLCKADLISKSLGTHDAR